MMNETPWSDSRGYRSNSGVKRRRYSDHATTVNRNIVRTIQPPGQLWTIRDLDAKIKKNGDIKVEGKGLVLAGGNGIGSPPANPTSVFATLICEAAAPFIEHSTTLTGVPLAPNGDFKIDDVLVPMPDGCASPVLLIRTASGGALVCRRNTRPRQIRLRFV